MYLAVRKNAYTCFELFNFYVLISLLDLNIKQNTYNQNGAVLIHFETDLSVLVQKLFLRKRNFSFLLILFMTLGAKVPSGILSSNKHPRYFTLECCLICISPYFM